MVNTEGAERTLNTSNSSSNGSNGSPIKKEDSAKTMIKKLMRMEETSVEVKYALNLVLKKIKILTNKNRYLDERVEDLEKEKVTLKEEVKEEVRKAQKLDDEKALLEDKFKNVESPMYYRSAIEMLEIFYIPETDKRENMFRLQRWEYILKLHEPSVAMLRDAITERGHGLTLENFPRLIRDAYKDCNNSIHEYFRKKFGLHSSLKIYFQSYNLHFGMGLTKRAVEVLVNCITKFESPTKTPQCTNEPTSGISKTPEKTLQSTNKPTSGISKNLFERRDFDRGFKRPRFELSDQNSNVPRKRYRNSEHDSERYFPRFPNQNYSYSEQYRNSERYPPPYQHNTYSKQYRNSERYPPPSYQHYNFK